MLTFQAGMSSKVRSFDGQSVVPLVITEVCTV